MSLINQLFELQKIDTQLQEIIELLGDLPSKVEELNQEKIDLVEALEADKKRLTEIELNMGKMALHIREVQEKIAKLKEQLYLVTNNRQYDALTLEMDFLKTELEKTELENLELMELKEQLKERNAVQEKNLESVKKDLKARREHMETRMAESAEKKTLLETRRKQAADNIEPNILARYERISKARKGLAVAAIDGNACGGCGSLITAQVIANIRQGSDIFTCDVCSRFLCWES